MDFRSEERGLSRKHIIESVKASLLRLQLSYIDVVIVHKADPMCPMEEWCYPLKLFAEIVRAMHYVICQGWVMYWGTARWSPVEIMEAYTNCRQFNCVTPIVEQTEYHMFCREKTELYMPELYNKIGVGLMAWSPISMGFTQGKEDSTIQLFSRASFRNKYSSFSWTEDETAAANKEGYSWMKERIQPEETRRHTERIRELNALAEKMGCTLIQLAVAWCLKNESVQCLLLGASTVDQLYESVQSLQKPKPSTFSVCFSFAVGTREAPATLRAQRATTSATPTLTPRTARSSPSARFSDKRLPIKTPDEKPVKEKVRWSYSPDEGPRCTTEPFVCKKKEKKAAQSPVQINLLHILVSFDTSFKRDSPDGVDYFLKLWETLARWGYSDPRFEFSDPKNM
ncbi:hypothetical protein NQ318_003281 [Aromia moschata]|uniref:NADP-dependent oxidoreductase domain-containing protein n=1 Tax=Aromia moschata TaxID=1265417 RepID=A0AAV8YM96_9CUCU|nr:hypothetical protein NQ318_003281 [Aromia moschata]